eukprot:GDKK01060960.1.p1 GENE.GDKK01060960.1~~GDKK01060960.1.p1  ORF type:complete len:168 (-),score=20.59 GDKK01060960.1:239-742(-)
MTNARHQHQAHHTTALVGHTLPSQTGTDAFAGFDYNNTHKHSHTHSTTSSGNYTSGQQAVMSPVTAAVGGNQRQEPFSRNSSANTGHGAEGRGAPPQQQQRRANPYFTHYQQPLQQPTAKAPDSSASAGTTPNPNPRRRANNNAQYEEENHYVGFTFEGQTGRSFFM